jgi:hypothetical protein
VVMGFLKYLHRLHARLAPFRHLSPPIGSNGAVIRSR